MKCPGLDHYPKREVCVQAMEATVAVAAVKTEAAAL